MYNILLCEDEHICIRDRMIFDEFVDLIEVSNPRCRILALEGLDDTDTRDFDAGIRPVLMSRQVCSCISSTGTRAASI